jgi:hypothetical protein
MKYLIANALVSLSFSLSIAGCNGDEPMPTQNNDTISEINNPTSNTMKITVGSSIFTATLYDNETVTAFKAMLPLTINMSELNGNEKYYDLPNNLPTNASVGGAISTGDLTLYGNNTLVLFYESFNTSYSYTRLGKIDNPSGLVADLGTGSVEVKFELN